MVGGQKWVRAGWGTGFLALSERGLDRLRPTLGGWTGVQEPTRYDGAQHPPVDGAQRFSITNGSPFASAALAVALELVDSVGVPAIEAVIAERAGSLIALLDGAGVRVVSPRPVGQRAGIVVAETRPGRGAAVHEALTAAGITTTRHAPDRIRLSVHVTTPETTLEAAADVLADR